jgi:hypothetical protein
MKTSLDLLDNQKTEFGNLIDKSRQQATHVLTGSRIESRVVRLPVVEPMEMMSTGLADMNGFIVPTDDLTYGQTLILVEWGFCYV